MKAVYEMPKVSFEAFMANNAVAVCGNFMWDNVEDDEWDDFPSGEKGNVLSSAIGISGCDWNAGFADYSNFTKLNPNDNIANSEVSFINTDGEHTERNENLTWGTQVVNVAKNLLSTFKGWLYFSEGEEDYDGQYGTWGWSTAGGNLSYTKTEDLCDDAWLAPVFTSNGTSI